jgi:hypothetical protein
MKSNFVVFAHPRTGSGALTSALNSQKDIFCLKEIFKKNIPDLKYMKVNMKDFLGEDPLTWQKNRDENFKDFLNKLSEKSEKKIFGYKFFPKHFRAFPNNEIYLNYLKENNTKIIILERKNILLQYISVSTARLIDNYTTSVKNKKFKEVFKLNPIEIDYDRYIKYNKIIKRERKEQNKAVEDYNLQYIHITYEDFTGEKFIECFKKIFNLLDLNFKDFIDVRDDVRKNGDLGHHRKINVYKLQDKILNYAEFKKNAEDNNDTETLNFLKEE